ncbi:MAG: replication-relaxation family protein [Bacillota bacterium]
MAVSAATAFEAYAAFTLRELVLARLYQAQTLTIDQLCTAIPCQKTVARRVLSALLSERLAVRFPVGDPLRPRLFAYCLTPAGMSAVAELCEDDERARALYKAMPRRTAKTLAAQARHNVAASEFFVALIRESDPAVGRGLVLWEGPLLAAQRFLKSREGQPPKCLLRPDATGEYRFEDGTKLRFCLELDRGTAGLEKIALKARRYCSHELQDRLEGWAALFVCPTRRRARGVFDALVRDGDLWGPGDPAPAVSSWEEFAWAGGVLAARWLALLDGEAAEVALRDLALAPAAGEGGPDPEVAEFIGAPRRAPARVRGLLAPRARGAADGMTSPREEGR